MHTIHAIHQVISYIKAYINTSKKLMYAEYAVWFAVGAYRTVFADV